MSVIYPVLYDKGKGEPISFSLKSKFAPAGDQIQAIDDLYKGIIEGKKDQVLLGVTGSGKTFTMANLIQKLNRPALIMAPNKILAAQLHGEMKEFFPNNAVEYFVSYYDYYQPEAYVARTDTFIEKTAAINEEIDRMRHSATRALLERRDAIVVASVSCIYGIGSVTTYSEMTFILKVGQLLSIHDMLSRFVELQYKRNDMFLARGTFRVRGDTIEIFPSHFEDRAWRIQFFDDLIEKISEFDALTGEVFEKLDSITIFANSHYVTPGPTLKQAIKMIKADLIKRVAEFESQEKHVERQRLSQRIEYDLAMLSSTGFCAGIENYSRYLTGRKEGEPPPTLFEYLPKDAILFVDESHVSVPQIQGMYRGDFARKSNLSEHGFRLPSCMDNRPLKFEEWDKLRHQTIFVSATPGPFELTQTHGEFVQQIIRPTGLLDPICAVHECEGQIDDLMNECKRTIENGYRVLVTTLTKKMAEALNEYLAEAGFKVKYLHSDIETLERIEIIKDLRLGVFDILVGINLLREGLDIPECALVAILDADKEGFLRSKNSLIQTIGRAARNANGKVILYADKMTTAMKEALSETERRRFIQMQYNEVHNITPKTTIRHLSNDKEKEIDASFIINDKKFEKKVKELEKKMKDAASNLDFEKACKYRDELKKLNALKMEQL